MFGPSFNILRKICIYHDTMIPPHFDKINVCNTRVVIIVIKMTNTRLDSKVITDHNRLEYSPQ